MTVIVKKIGGSVAVIIPKTLAQQMELSEGTSLDISGSVDAIMMRKPGGKRPRRSIDKIIARISQSGYRRRSLELSERLTTGKEIW